MGNVQYILKLQKANNYTILLQTSAATAQSFHITNIDCLSSASLSRGTSAYSSAGITHLAGSLLLSQPHLAGSLLLCQHLLPGSLLLRQHLLPGDFSSASFSCWTSASLSRRTLARLSRVTTTGLSSRGTSTSCYCWTSTCTLCLASTFSPWRLSLLILPCPLWLPASC